MTRVIAISRASRGNMPPELPDVEQLQAMGEGYVVDAVANHAESQTGWEVPEEARDVMRKQMQQMTDQAVDLVLKGSVGPYPPSR
jgi:hypothetical protein